MIFEHEAMLRLTDAVRTDIKYAKNSVTFCPS